MSEFFTRVPVDIDDLRKALPKTAHVSRVVFDLEAKELRVTWADDGLRARYTNNNEFPLERLRERRLPGGDCFGKSQFRAAWCAGRTCDRLLFFFAA